MEVLVVIPTYNERENIRQLVTEIFSLPFELRILIVDDASPDGTGKIADRLTAEDERVMVLHRGRKQGLGTAYIEGFTLGLKTEASYFLQMDADFSHSPEEILRLLDGVKDADMVVGSRYIKGSKILNWSIRRKLLSAMANLLTRVILSIPIKDITSGFRIFRREVLESIALKEIRAKGFAFQIEMLYHIYHDGFKIKEVPITFTNRKKGGSKLVFGIIWEVLLTVVRLRLKRPKKL
ncbi:MAG TPA: polyprenol monophosphomannose synthase [Candidatus Omnitrophica bacterium]|nr:polyprenol monophosphomannose synthase [Candidatus Omnitrophota bacterium]